MQGGFGNPPLLLCLRQERSRYSDIHFRKPFDTVIKNHYNSITVDFIHIVQLIQVRGQEAGMTIVRQILQTKGYDVYSVPPQATILDALKEMERRGIGAVLVMSGDKVQGIFSERDYARRVVLKGLDVSAPVEQVMTKVVYYVSPAESVDECMAQMADKKIRHLPVVEDGKVVGLISVGDVVNTIMTDQKSLIQGMENYILGRDYNQ